MPIRKKQRENDLYDGEDPVRYSKYSINTKKKLIRLVYEQGKKINSAAKQCKMNESTAKMALKTYRDNYQRQHGYKPVKYDKRNQNHVKLVPCKEQEPIVKKEEPIVIKEEPENSQQVAYTYYPIPMPNAFVSGVQVGYFWPLSCSQNLPCFSNQDD